MAISLSALTITGLATFKTKRRIGSFSAQVTITEDHSDRLQITDHPVERGAVISDHAIKQPARLSVTCGWSNSDGQLSAAAIADILSGGYVRTVYQNFLVLQATRLPFSVMTGKRNYQNMLIESIGTTTDKESENSLLLNIEMREINIVQTQTITIPPRDVQANPEETAETMNAGNKQAVPAKVPNQAALGKTLLQKGADFITQ